MSSKLLASLQRCELMSFSENVTKFFELLSPFLHQKFEDRLKTFKMAMQITILIPVFIKSNALHFWEMQCSFVTFNITRRPDCFYFKGGSSLPNSTCQQRNSGNLLGSANKYTYSPTSDAGQVRNLLYIVD